MSDILFFIILFFIIIFISFIAGGVYISNCELKFAKKCKYNCLNCESSNCLYKFCSKQRKEF